jgi:hypothetical protein
MSNLLNKIGKIKIAGELIFETPEEKILKALFSNFYPVSTEIDHSCGWNRDVYFYGYSEHFRDIEDGKVIPAYDFVFKRDEKGDVFFDSCIELK